MVILLLVGLIVLIVGKLKLTRSITLTGTRARWYGLTLFLTAVPFALLVSTVVVAIAPETFLAHPIWSRVLNYGVVIGYLVLLALPFRERHITPTPQPTEARPQHYDPEEF